MPTPTYVSASNYLKGVSAVETAINISAYSQSWEDEKLFIQNKGGSNTGFVHNFNVSTTATITGETNVATLSDTMGVAFGTAETVANSISGYGVTAGGFYMDSIEISQERGALATATVTLTKHPDIA
jgi:hypothetical protein